MSIAVAVSGGADSLYALTSLQEARKRNAGEEVFAIHARFRDVAPDADPVPMLQKWCREADIVLHIADLREAFSECIVRPFGEAYARGETPNPCVWCNVRMKFGLLWDEARKLGAERIATGHYAALVEHPRYGLALRQGVDVEKDQSYFLALTPLERLRNAFFPLKESCKSDIVSRLEAGGFVLPHESQEICFVPKDDYRAFLKEQGIRLPGPGPMIVGDGLVVGRHDGLWQYTEGQRRGLGVSWKEPLYVIGKNRARNALLLGTAAELAVSGCVAGELNLLVPPAMWPNELRVRIRYRQKAVPADVRLVGGGPDGTEASARMLVRFHTPQLPSAPGQLVAVFDEHGYVLAGGVILKDG